MNGLIAATLAHPDVNAVDTYAAAEHWTANPPEFNALINAKVGYHGKINGQKVVLSSDGTNDIFGLTINDGFEPQQVVAALRQAFTMKYEGPDDSAGERAEGYTLSDHGEQVGLVFVTYGAADAVKGVGTVGFMSSRKMQDALKHRKD